MGMDVYGKAATSETGRYFRRNVWGWRPLAQFVLNTAPEGLTAQCKHWHSNDGDGLDAKGSLLLAAHLEKTVQDGTAAAYVAERDAHLAAMPDESCDLCHGSGVRDDEVGKHNGMTTRLIDAEGHPRKGQVGWCNGCDGKGSHRPMDTWYRLDVSDIAEFAAFLRDCGGFEIC